MSSASRKIAAHTRVDSLLRYVAGFADRRPFLVVFNTACPEITRADSLVISRAFPLGTLLSPSGKDTLKLFSFYPDTLRSLAPSI
jgi:hypothetical protein